MMTQLRRVLARYALASRAGEQRILAPTHKSSLWAGRRARIRIVCLEVHHVQNERLHFGPVLMATTENPIEEFGHVQADSAAGIEVRPAGVRWHEVTTKVPDDYILEHCC